MILQQLEKDLERILSYDSDGSNEEEGDTSEAETDSATPSMYEVKAIAWKIVLDMNGTFLGLIPLSGGGKKDKGKMMPVPSVVRASAMRSLLFADTPAYLLGLELEEAKAPLKHEVFKDLVAEFAAVAQPSWLPALNIFFENGVEAAKQAATTVGVNKSDLMTFQIGDVWPVEQPEVQAFWANDCRTKAKKSNPMQCLVCGQERPAMESMPFMIKGIPDGQTSGTALVSININVFESYGLKRATNSPICAQCAERFSKALKGLMKSRRTHQRTGALVYTFWTVDEAQDIIPDLLNQPAPQEVRELIKSPLDGKRREVVDANFYALALSANAARIVVRNWLTLTVGEVLSSLAQWYRWQQMVDAYGAEGLPVPIWRLAGCLYRTTTTGKINTEDVEKRISEALYASALQGSPLPIDLLHRAVMRNRAENQVTYERAALMAAVLRSHNALDETWLMETEEQMVAQLATEERTPDTNEQARLCGQLMALLEELQYLSAQVDNRKLNATLVDRCFGAASSAPATVFGTLLTDAQAHLTKLRKARPGTYDALQSQLENLLSVLDGFSDGFPRTLTLRQQALFSLGYYKRRAEIRRGKTEGAMLKRAKDEKATEAPTLDMGTDTTEEEEN